MLIVDVYSQKRILARQQVLMVEQEGISCRWRFWRRSTTTATPSRWWLKKKQQGSHSLTTCRTNSRGTPTKARKFLSLNIQTGLFLDLGRGEKEGNRDLVAKTVTEIIFFAFDLSGSKIDSWIEQPSLFKIPTTPLESKISLFQILGDLLPADKQPSVCPA